MAIEYLGLSEINGPLVVLEGVKGASYEEMVEFTVDGKEKKLGRIVEIYEDKAVIQVFEGSENMSLDNTHTRLSGRPMEIALSPDILGRTFDGVGNPIDGLGPVVSDTRVNVNGLKPGDPGVPAKLYPHRYFRDRRSDHPDPRTEAADLLRKRSSPRQAGSADRAAGFSGKQFG